MNLSHIGWLRGNFSEIISLVDSIANESQAISNNLQIYATARGKYDLDRDNYNTQLDKVQFLRENLNMTAANAVMQNILQNLQLFPKCIKYTFGTDDWRQCNSNSQYNNTTPPLDLIFKSRYNLINASNTKITEISAQIVRNISNIDKLIKRPVDISSYNTIIKNYDDISGDIHKTFSNVTSNLYPLSQKSFVYGKLYTAPGLDLIRFKKIRNSLQELQDNIQDRNNEININIQKLASRFDQFESPLGKIPLGFIETIVAFPLLMAAGFFIYAFILRQVMRLRIDLYREYQGNDPKWKLKTDSYVSFLAPIWINPLLSKRKQLLQMSLST
jgi:hypothetical protein